jgi:hypothetical protein
MAAAWRWWRLTGPALTDEAKRFSCFRKPVGDGWQLACQFGLLG